VDAGAQEGDQGEYRTGGSLNKVKAHVQEAAMFKRIDHVEIIPSNFDRSLRFYTEVLGFTVKQQMKVTHPPLLEIAYLSLGDTVLELMRVADPACATTDPWSVGFRMMALEVDDMDQALKFLGSHGVQATWGPVDLGDSKRAEIHDADGLGIELRQWYNNGN
jgi:glyoxylase I family protein